MMRYKTLFRLLSKLLGVYFIVLGFGNVTSLFAFLGLSYWVSGSLAGFFDSSFTISTVSTSLWQLAAGLYLFFRGERIVNLAIPSNRAYCANCGYEMRGAPTPICPECGVHQQTGTPPA